jgi:nitrate reductase NapE component
MQRLPHQTGSFVDISVVGTTKPKIIGCIDTDPRLREPTPVIVDTAAMRLPDALTIPARALTSVTSTVESAMTQPPQQPPTQVFAQQRRSGCGTLLVALLVLAIITAIVIFLGAFGLLGWIFS